MSDATDPTTTAFASIGAMLVERAAEQGDRTILRHKDRGIWKQVSWRDLAARARAVGTALLADGFAPGNVACVLSSTRPEWAYVDLGVLGIGGVCGGLDLDATPDALERMLSEHSARVLFVEGEEQLDTVLELQDRCPTLRRIVIFDMKGLRELSDPRCESLDAFLARSPADGAAWDTAARIVQGGQPAVLLAPPGDTPPVTLTHRDVFRRLATTAAPLGLHPGDERLAFLPMSEAAERIDGFYLSLQAGMISNYVESADTVPENLGELQPTIMTATPRIYERLHDGIAARAREATFLQRHAYGWALRAGERASRGKTGRGLAGLLAEPVLGRVRGEIGFRRVRHALVADGALPPSLARWYAALGVHLLTPAAALPPEIAGGAPLTTSGTTRNDPTYADA